MTLFIGSGVASPITGERDRRWETITTGIVVRIICIDMLGRVVRLSSYKVASLAWINGSRTPPTGPQRVPILRSST